MSKLVFLLLLMMTVLCVSIPANARFFRTRAFKPVSVRTNIGPRVNPRLYDYHPPHIQYTPPRVSRPSKNDYRHLKTTDLLKHEITTRSLPVVHSESLPVPLSHYEMTLLRYAMYSPDKPIVEEHAQKGEKKVSKEETIRTVYDIIERIEKAKDYYEILLWSTDTTTNDSTVIDDTIYFE